MTLRNDERLRKMPFLDFLIEIHSDVRRIYYNKNSNSAYEEAYAIGRLYKTRYMNEHNLEWNDVFPEDNARYAKEATELLDRYNKAKSYKAKNETIIEFKNEFIYFLGRYIYKLGGKTNPDDY